MTEKETRPADDGADHHPRTAAISSWAWTFCVQCNALKPLGQMRADRRFRTGRRRTCEECDPILDRNLVRAKQWVRNFLNSAYMYGIPPVWELVTPADLIARYDDHCYICLDGDFEVSDHYVPIGAGGHHVIDNLRPCCARCNRKKISSDRAAIRRYREALRAQTDEPGQP